MVELAKVLVPVVLLFVLRVFHLDPCSVIDPAHGGGIGAAVLTDTTLCNAVRVEARAALERILKSRGLSSPGGAIDRPVQPRDTALASTHGP